MKGILAILAAKQESRPLWRESGGGHKAGNNTAGPRANRHPLLRLEKNACLQIWKAIWKSKSLATSDGLIGPPIVSTGPSLTDRTVTTPGARSRTESYIDVGIRGWSQHDDALKLYEMAFFAEGDILELGCFEGLSTSIVAQAIADADRSRKMHTIDLDPMC